MRTHSLLVTLAIFLSMFTRIHFMSTFFSRGILLVATESHVPLTTCSGLIKYHLVDLYDQGIWLQVGQLSIKAGSWDLAKAFKHYYIFGFHLPEAIKTITMIHYCYCLMVSGKWRRIIYCKADYIIVLYRNCNWKERTLMLPFNFDIQNCQRFVPSFMETSPALKNSWLRALLARKRFSQHNKNKVMHYKNFFLNIIDYNLRWF